MLNHIEGICSADQPNGFTCPNGRTTFSSSVIWGAIGPGRVYSLGKIYGGLLHFFWIGALAPVVTWYLYRHTRRDWLRLVNWPLIFVGTYNVPPATGINYSSWALVNVIFNHWLKRKWFAWWSKYNYVLAAALDTGLALSAIVIFFCIMYPGAQFPNWWGESFFPPPFPPPSSRSCHLFILVLFGGGRVLVRGKEREMLMQMREQGIQSTSTPRMAMGCRGFLCPTAACSGRRTAHGTKNEIATALEDRRRNRLIAWNHRGK
jgi:hypothetical protein